MFQYFSFRMFGFIMCNSACPNDMFIFSIIVVLSMKELNRIFVTFLRFTDLTIYKSTELFNGIVIEQSRAESRKFVFDVYSRRT